MNNRNDIYNLNIFDNNNKISLILLFEIKLFIIIHYYL